MSRKRLKELGLDLPLLPTTAVGSFPQPPELGEAREKVRLGGAPAGEAEEPARQATAEWIRRQEEAGLDVLVDGEMYRDDPVSFFAGRLKGFRPGGLVRSHDNHFRRQPILKGAVHWEGPISVEWWRYAQSLTARPVKGVVTGAFTMMDGSFNEHYPTRRTAALAIAREMRREAEALVRAGCKILQVDEPALSARPEEIDIAVEAMRAMVEGLDAYLILHACHGALRAGYPAMLRMPVHNFDLDLSSGGADLAAVFAANPLNRDLTIGLVDVQPRRTEGAEAVRKRLRRALEAVKPEALWVDPDCGLWNLTVEDAMGKLKAVQDAVEAARERL